MCRCSGKLLEECRFSMINFPKSLINGLLAIDFLLYLLYLAKKKGLLGVINIKKGGADDKS